MRHVSKCEVSIPHKLNISDDNEHDTPMLVAAQLTWHLIN